MEAKQRCSQDATTAQAFRAVYWRVETLMRARSNAVEFASIGRSLAGTFAWHFAQYGCMAADKLVVVALTPEM